MTRKWSIWYEDGTHQTSADFAPEQVQRFGVQVIVQESDQAGRFNQCMDDTYVWKDGRWFGMDRIGMTIYLMTNPGPCIVLFGTTTDSKTFQRLLEQAEADPFIPPRCAKRKGEVVP